MAPTFLTRKRSPGDDHHPQVIHTPWDPDPNRRYKLMTFAYYDGYWASYSPDGIHWRDVEENPVLVDPGDVAHFVWDAHTQRYLGYPKIWVDDVRGHKRRCVGFTQTTDFESWPKSKLILVPDEHDDRWAKGGGAHTDFYGLSAFPYESAYLGFLWVYRIGPGDHRIHIELVSSHDGVQWVRQEEPRTPILPLGEPGQWDDGMLFTTTHPLVEGDTIKLFYGGFDGPHDAEAPNAATGLATLRKDGFASLDAGDEPGVVTTKPIRGGAGPLRLNADARGGSIAVEVLDADGHVLPGYSRSDCNPVGTDGVDQNVTWRSHKEPPRGQGPVAFRFLMERASLYSFAAGEGATVVVGKGAGE